MNLPKFITFTGADDKTNVHEMAELASHYPVEFGILLSKKREGTTRYPSTKWITEQLLNVDLALSAHLCGEDARSVLENGVSRHDELICRYFNRAQINTSDPDLDAKSVYLWGFSLVIEPILQCRKSEFPESQDVQWLFDVSGGEGKTPALWPFSRQERLVGYAGGINPINALQTVEILSQCSNNYWIDMESGVRDENDNFSIELCWKVCEAVYGAR